MRPVIHLIAMPAVTNFASLGVLGYCPTRTRSSRLRPVRKRSISILEQLVWAIQAQLIANQTQQYLVLIRLIWMPFESCALKPLYQVDLAIRVYAE